MLIDFKSWLHHLLNPHCIECKFETELKNTCKSCGILGIQIDILRRENEDLLKTLLDIVNPKKEIVTENESHEPVRMTPISWREKKKILERNSKEEYRRMREASNNGLTIKDLEKVAGIEDASEIKEAI